jgi:Domain of unknown function (DUF4287)
MPDRVQGPAYYFPSIEKKYGQPISYWLDLISSSQLTRHKQLVDWLKAGYGIGHGHATASTRSRSWNTSRPSCGSAPATSSPPVPRPASATPATRSAS